MLCFYHTNIARDTAKDMILVVLTNQKANTTSNNFKTKTAVATKRLSEIQPWCNDSEGATLNRNGSWPDILTIRVRQAFQRRATEKYSGGGAQKCVPGDSTHGTVTVVAVEVNCLPEDIGSTKVFGGGCKSTRRVRCSKCVC